MRTPARLVAAGVLAASLVLVGAGVAGADATATAVVSDSPGFLSGNVVQAPVDAPVNTGGLVVSHVVWSHWWWSPWWQPGVVVVSPACP